MGAEGPPTSLPGPVLRGAGTRPGTGSRAGAGMLLTGSLGLHLPGSVAVGTETHSLFIDVDAISR